MLEKQKIESGNDSINVQVSGNMTCGISYADAKQIAQDVFNQNFLKLRSEASCEANKRANEITELVLEKIRRIDPNLCNLFGDVNVQYGMYQLQKTYALEGNDDIRDLLANVMVERLKSNDKEQNKIIYNEALSTMKLLTPNHLTILASIFLMRCVGLRDPSKEYIEKYFSTVLGFLKNGKDLNKDIIFEHLAYARCISPTGAMAFPSSMTFEPYISTFFGVEVPSDPNKLESLISSVPTFGEIQKIWDLSPICRCNLTSVGKVIAITYIKDNGLDLSYDTWID